MSFELLFGWLTLLGLGALLALVAALLPRLLERWEPGITSGRLGLTELETPAPRPEELRAPTRLAAVPEAVAGRPQDVSDEPLLAAAIALALALYEEEQARGWPSPVRDAGANPWSLAGRWQIMQARRNIAKR